MAEIDDEAQVLGQVIGKRDRRHCLEKCVHVAAGEEVGQFVDRDEGDVEHVAGLDVGRGIFRMEDLVPAALFGLKSDDLVSGERLEQGLDHVELFEGTRGRRDHQKSSPMLLESGGRGLDHTVRLRGLSLEQGGG